MTKRQQLFCDIAEGFDKPEGERADWMSNGICVSILGFPHTAITKTDRIFETFTRWADRSDPLLIYSLWWRANPESDQQRVLFSLFMAAMSDEDFYVVEEA